MRKLTTYHVKDENIVICDCGVHIAKLSKWAVDKGFIGYEGLINLPVTVAGAVVNNSGCYGCGIDKILKSIDLLKPDGTIVNIEVGELGYSFRSSSFRTGKLQGIILRAYLVSNKGLSAELKKIADSNTINRKRYQDPPAFNLGSSVNLYHFYPSSKIRNLIIRLFIKVYRLIESDILMQNKCTKDLILLLYRKRYLAKYISDKRISCFLWKDEKADEFFDDYIRLLKSLYKQVSIEIEIYS